MSEIASTKESHDGRYKVVDLLRRLFGEEIHPRWRIFLVFVVLIFALAGANAATTYAIKRTFDQLPRAEMSETVVNSIFLATCYVMIAIAEYLSILILAKLEFGIIASLQRKISDCVAGSPPSVVSGEGYVASQMFFMTESGWRLINASIIILRELIVIVSMSVTASLMFAGMAPLFAVVAVIYGGMSAWYIVVARRLIMGKFEGMRRIIDEVLVNIRSGKQPDKSGDSEEPSIDSAIQLYRENGTQLRIVAARLSLITQIVTGIVAAGILVWGTWRTAGGSGSLGAMVSFQYAFLTFAPAAARLAGTGVTAGADLAVVKEMYRFLDSSRQQHSMSVPKYPDGTQP